MSFAMLDSSGNHHNCAPYAPLGHQAGRRGQHGSERVQLLLRYLAAAHACYYIITGLWSLVSIGTFQKVTGPKADLWLVKTVGVLVTVIGAVIGMAARRPSDKPRPEIATLAVGSALGLAGIDVVYVAKRRIGPVYLLDALAEILLAGAWL